jgi:inorganic triphosphatase YgiF
MADRPRREGLEIEAKLGVSKPRRIFRLVRELGPGLEPFVAAGPLSVALHTDRYFDTADGRLAQLQIRARIRGQGRDRTLAVKRGGVERHGVTTRTELEGPATEALDPARWPPSAARTALLELIEDAPIVEIARLRQRRLTRLVRGLGATIELSLDREDVLDGDRIVARRYELEAELHQGGEAAVAALAGLLARIDGLGPPGGSKLAFALEPGAAAGA